MATSAASARECAEIKRPRRREASSSGQPLRREPEPKCSGSHPHGRELVRGLEVPHLGERIVGFLFDLGVERVVLHHLFEGEADTTLGCQYFALEFGKVLERFRKRHETSLGRKDGRKKAE